MITDSITKAALPNAKVTILAWYDAGFDKTDYVCIDTVTDNTGQFAATFDKGYKITVASVATNYYPSIKSSETDKNKSLAINLMLKRKPSSENDFDSTYKKINLTNYIIQNSDN